MNGELTDQDLASREYQARLRRATFGSGSVSTRLASAFDQVFIEIDALGHCKARVLDPGDDSGVNATSWALAHRLDMGPDMASDVGLSMSDASSWAKIGTTLLRENTDSSDVETHDWTKVQNDAHELLSEAFEKASASNH